MSWLSNVRDVSVGRRAGVVPLEHLPFKFPQCHLAWKGTACGIDCCPFGRATCSPVRLPLQPPARVPGLWGWSIQKNLCTQLYILCKTYFFSFEQSSVQVQGSHNFNRRTKLIIFMLFPDWAFSITRELFRSLILFWNQKPNQMNR